ncbi:NUDIX domain-containing protein [bacterium]|nr:NUDIX domain-containing protein [bacterium]
MIQRIRVSGVLVSDNKILLVSHKKKDDEYWLLPGGGVDVGETLEVALLREFLEETGIHVKVEKVLFLSDTIYPDASKQIHHIIFAVSEAVSSVDRISISDADIVQAKYIEISKLKDLKFYPPVNEKIMEFLHSGDQRYGAEYLGKLWE